MNPITNNKPATVSPVFDFIIKINSKLDHLIDITKSISKPLQNISSDIEVGQPTELLSELNQIDKKIAQILDCIVI